MEGIYWRCFVRTEEVKYKTIIRWLSFERVLGASHLLRIIVDSIFTTCFTAPEFSTLPFLSMRVLGCDPTALGGFSGALWEKR